ncbi:hypothetical protein, partial [Pseudomonas syringae group genomosp. 7]|uniref:hypothetical protein n=1 Tax=Pseudomonas syringae group genomosp. 7 TaxID=251699 RepID=UPI00377041BA
MGTQGTEIETGGGRAGAPKTTGRGCGWGGWGFLLLLVGLGVVYGWVLWWVCCCWGLGGVFGGFWVGCLCVLGLLGWVGGGVGGGGGCLFWCVVLGCGVVVGVVVVLGVVFVVVGLGVVFVVVGGVCFVVLVLLDVCCDLFGVVGGYGFLPVTLWGEVIEVHGKEQI